MRWLNLFAAVSGACALMALAASHHLRPDDPNFSFVLIAALAQMSAAAAGLAIANRSGRLNLIAGAIILAGAALFPGEIYINAFNDNHPLHFLAPIGGGLMILGWLALGFTNPQERD